MGSGPSQPRTGGGNEVRRKVGVLWRVLAQEVDTGYQDRAVIGGLDRFLTKSAAELHPSLGDIKPYAILTPHERRGWVSDLIDRIKASGLDVALDATRTMKGRGNKNVSGGDDGNGVRSLKIGGGIARHLPRLERLGIRTLNDAIYHFPHRHNDFAHVTKISKLEHGMEQTVVATVWEATETKRGPGRTSTQAVLGDETGNVRAVWFGQGYLAKTFKPGTEIVISGEVKTFKGRHIFESPEYELLTGQEELVHTGRLVPVYPTTEGLPQRTLRRIVRAALKERLGVLKEDMPLEVREREGLIGLKEAISQIHYPDSGTDLQAARKRLAFDEMLILQLAVLRRRSQWRDEAHGLPLLTGSKGPTKGLVDSFLSSLPFDLTGAQRRVIGEVRQDLAKERPMVRLLQGDVGSGKTIIAIVALLAAVDSGLQGAFMAPTEILAEQHFLTVGRLLARTTPVLDKDGASARIVLANGNQIVTALLTGSTGKGVRKRLLGAIGDGKVDILIGTHALIQESVGIPKLAVGVVDEQHRFGVMQRAALGQAESRPHLLAMSATPIPRSLSLTVFGDLDVSLLDEMPAGRKSIKTRWVARDQRSAAYDFIKGEVEAGKQAFIVFPLVEGSEAVQARAATEEHERLSRDVFSMHRLGLLHGRMKTRDKEEIMERFSSRELDILVSTSVIEVGIDVPNATVMMVDGAERFGLAQLHQFRGRVGRGTEQSYCLLLSEATGPEAAQRLRIIEDVVDGFRLAEEDLKLRGPGDYLGTRQSGLPELRVTTVTDTVTASKARREANRMLEVDPDLKSPEHSLLALKLSKLLVAANLGAG